MIMSTIFADKSNNARARLAVVVYDALTQRRHFHPATLAALAVVIVGTVANGVLAASAFGGAFVAGLE
jgi:hypothetical protein